MTDVVALTPAQVTSQVDAVVSELTGSRPRAIEKLTTIPALPVEPVLKVTVHTPVKKEKHAV